jgi:hypothetical protein
MNVLEGTKSKTSENELLDNIYHKPVQDHGIQEENVDSEIFIAD